MAQVVAAKLDCPERQRRIQEIATKSSVQSTQRRQWVADATAIGKDVAHGNTRLAPIFWIRLYGILHDLHKQTTSLQDAVTAIGASPSGSLGSMLSSIEDLGRLFSQDELAYIQYRRDVECHPVQEHYELSIAKNGAIRESLTLKLLGNERPSSTAEFRAAITRVLATASSEPALAQAFAARSARALENLQRISANIF
jgi:hypothetical protein